MARRIQVKINRTIITTTDAITAVFAPPMQLSTISTFSLYETLFCLPVLGDSSPGGCLRMGLVVACMGLLVILREMALVGGMVAP